MSTTATDDRTAALGLMRRLVREGIMPFAPRLGPIILNGRIACVVFELHTTGFEAARALGWDGSDPVFEPKPGAMKKMAKLAARCGDAVTERWVNSRRDGRVFVLMHQGTLLLNNGPNGWGIEPGSTERASS